MAMLNNINNQSVSLSTHELYTWGEPTAAHGLLDPLGAVKPARPSHSSPNPAGESFLLLI